MQHLVQKWVFYTTGETNMKVRRISVMSVMLSSPKLLIWKGINSLNMQVHPTTVTNVTTRLADKIILSNILTVNMQE